MPYGRRLVFRPFHSGGALFDTLTWETHILTPVAAILYAALLERFSTAPPTRAELEAFFAGDLDFPTDKPEIQRFVRFLTGVGCVQ